MRPSKRNEIIRATIELVAERGVHDIPTIKIAEKADVAEITLFRNFKSKEGLLEATFDEVMAQAQSYVYDQIDDNLPVEERFLAMCRRFSMFRSEYPQEFSAFEQYYMLPIWNRLGHQLDPTGITGFEKGHQKGIINLLITGQKEGRIRQLPIAIMLGMILGAIFNVDPELPAQQKEEVFLMLWKAVASR